MVQSQYCLLWDSYKNSICNGLSSLQQNGEFVDMTIAADGHFVKVHQIVMALASPYLKELITSAPCQHPVIFLNNVSHRSLCSLLEYIYTGEALIPAEALSAFIDTGKALHIKGLESMSSSEMDLPVRVALNVSQLDSNEFKHTMSASEDKMDQIQLTRKFVIKPEIQSARSTNVTISSEQMTDYADDPGHDSDDGQQFTNQMSTFDSQASLKDKLSSNLQFTVSIRGSLQIILNRYMYNLHSLTSRSGVRRWRCVDYRNHKCMAFVVTKKNVVLSRGNLHNHPFHDKKILAKIEKNAVYSALDDVEGYKDKEPTEDTMKDETMDQEFLTLDFSENESDAIMKT